MRRSALSIAIKHIKPSIKPIVTIKFSKLDVVWLSVVVLNAVAPTFMDLGWGNLQVGTNKRIWRQRFQFLSSPGLPHSGKRRDFLFLTIYVPIASHFQQKKVNWITFFSGANHRKKIRSKFSHSLFCQLSRFEVKFASSTYLSQLLFNPMQYWVWSWPNLC